MIALLGARFAPDAEIQRALAATINLLRAHRASSGAMPNNVDSMSLKPNFRAYADAGLWWILGSTLIAPDPATTRDILRWYECQDVDQSGLISIQESSDWEDLFCTRGKGLYINCLYIAALRAAANILDGDESRRCRDRASRAATRINEWMWYAGDGSLLRAMAHTYSTEGNPAFDSLGRPRWTPSKRKLVDETYYLPYLGFRAAGEWFDTLGNLLAILTGVADARQSGQILDLIARHSLDRWPVRSLTPLVQSGDPDWREYYGDLNTPNHYHNGGVWPFIGGFYVAALVHAGRLAEGARALDRLAELNHRGEFNEWHNGETGDPMGVHDQAWSAGMYLFAHECVRQQTVPWLPIP
jgi:GH15 family glucan-1,4-alpha-glucosidase